MLKIMNYYMPGPDGSKTQYLLGRSVTFLPLHVANLMGLRANLVAL